MAQNQEEQIAVWKDEIMERAQTELAQYRNWLLQNTPEEVLNHAFSYTVMQDSVYALEGIELSFEQWKALRTADSPLGEITRAYMKRDFSDLMEGISNTIEAVADSQEKVTMEIYPHDRAYAREHGELEQMRASLTADRSCMRAIQEAIHANYQNNRLSTYGAKAVLLKYGPERTCNVTARLIEKLPHDGRIYKTVRQWSEQTLKPHQGNYQMKEDFYTDVHPGLLNLFAVQIQRELEPQKGNVQKDAVKKRRIKMVKSI